MSGGRPDGPSQPHCDVADFTVPRDAALVSDGGPATELETRGHDRWDGLGSARLLADAREEVAAGGCSRMRPSDIARIASAVRT